MDTKIPVKTARENLGKSLCKALELRRFKAHYAADVYEARDIVVSLVPDGASIGVPGSVTVREAGIIEALEAKGCSVAEHWKPGMTAEEKKQALFDELCADFFITGCNAISKDGVMVNIDGTGNRLAGMSWAPGKIIYIVGINKVEPDTHSAVKRARNTASPANAIRVGADTPCTKLGCCADCNVPGRICNILLITERATFGRECHVVVVGEDMGY